MSVAIHMHSAAPLGLATVQKVRAMGQHRSRAERELFKQAKTDLVGITNTLLIELENLLRARFEKYAGIAKHELRPSGFLASARFPKQMPVRVVAADSAYPTVVSLVQERSPVHVASVKVLFTIWCARTWRSDGTSVKTWCACVLARVLIRARVEAQVRAQLLALQLACVQARALRYGVARFLQAERQPGGECHDS